MKLHHSLLLALAASATALTAQQPDAPRPPDAPKPPTPPEARSSSRANRGEPEEKAVAYMGVLTREVPVEFRGRFGLPEGFGLMVDEVMPDSPAKTAGIKPHDILVKFADQQLVNMEQLLTLVRSKKKGAIVPFTVITGGKETQVSVTLAERMMPANEMRQPNRGFTGMPQMQQFFGGGPDVREHMEQLQRQMREYQERIQDWNRDRHRDPLQPGAQPEDHRGASSSSRDSQAHVESHAQSHTTSNIIRRDDSGEYQLKNEDGKRTFTARPKDGQQQSWPVNTDAERQAVPEKFREKLRLFDNVHQDLRGPDAPRPPEGGSRGSPPPAPKGRETSV
ncbi:MAG: S1C family serine protease [Prosthecobacter sp.]